MASTFSQFGIEIEYMIVDVKSLDLLPVSDKILRDASGTIANSVRHGPITWSNELVMHVLELKTSNPAKSLDGLVELFHQSILDAEKRLRKSGACLLGTAMHPWFEPFDGVKLWHYDDREIYDTFDRIFDSRGHGWSNIQSFHLNLPFEVGDDDSFRRLHSAIRLVLPLIPAIAASSPFLEGRSTGLLDTRLETYRNNCIRIPSISGGVIPEVYNSQAEYGAKVFDVIANDLKSLDQEGILEPEWTNARGAIARFDRGSIEIRVGDVQECPAQDLAIIQLVVYLVKWWFEQSEVSLIDQESVPTKQLRQLFDAAISQGVDARLEGEDVLRAFGVRSSMSVGVWIQQRLPISADWKGGIEVILSEGNLAQRLSRAVGQRITSENLQTVYRSVQSSLIKNQVFGV